MSCFDVDIRNCGLSLEAYTAMNTCVRALILDFGEVLTRSQPVHVLEQMAASAGLPAERFLVEERDGASYIHADNAARYTPFVLLAETVNVGQAVDLYVRMYPLLQRLETWFDIVIVSCEVGLCKPQPGIYRLCLERLEVPAASALFVDDRRENLEGAEAVGLRTLHFTGDESVPALRRVLGL